MKSGINFQEKFEERHIAPGLSDVTAMLEAVGVDSLEALIEQTVPERIRLAQPLRLPPALSEAAYLERIREIAEQNKVYKSYIGQGYYDVMVPGVILRNVFENPGWYTQYTPYQVILYKEEINNDNNNKSY